ncbi:hypothetical protein PCASD_15599 [Puccinia coronata f. sp. avenae]|uniref:Uncharacterized protein n=1 Tax=Puccinia coronata f. sp. avenae TaxID=200324 RepID=A0A2N5TY42_9BASI|nr:hypothetical protein PCASD_15599 [Puccinia coronata f. sp. avenae]
MAEEVVLRVTQRVRNLNAGQPQEQGEAEHQTNTQQQETRAAGSSVNIEDIVAGTVEREALVAGISKVASGLDNVQGVVVPPSVNVTGAGESTSATYRNVLSREVSDVVPAVISQGAAASKPLEAIPKTKSDLEKLGDKISEAIKIDDKETAKLLLRIYTKVKEAENLQVPQHLEQAKSADACLMSCPKKPCNKLEYVDGAIPNHFDVGFTPFFDKNIKDVTCPLPLTIFNKAWRKDALAFHAKKKSRSDEKDGIYAGYEYPNEWSQTLAQWTMNY